MRTAKEAEISKNTFSYREKLGENFVTKFAMLVSDVLTSILDKNDVYIRQKGQKKFDI